MKNMLDTHIALWFLNGERLSERIRDMIITGENYISIVSLWEVAIKMNIGKYDFTGGFSAFSGLVRKNGFIVLPIKDEYMEKLFELPLIHRDPFDRLIVATSVVEGIPIITADESIQKYDIAWVW
jgi:PIN domain nuclease of toxin-antitoxin system